MGGREEEENGHSLSVRLLQGHWHWTGTGGAAREQAFPLLARNLHFSPPPPPARACSAPLSTLQALARRRRLGVPRGGPPPLVLTRPVPAPTPPSALEGWALVLPSPGPWNRAAW